MRGAVEKRSKTLALQNAIVTVFEWSAGTVIFHVETREGHLQQASVWVNTDELEAVANMLLSMKEKA